MTDRYGISSRQHYIWWFDLQHEKTVQRPTDMTTKTPDKDILKEGESCWRIATANRAALLVDGAAYFEALRKSLLQAERCVFITGWDIDSRTRLVGPSNKADDDLPEALGPFLTELVQRRPKLKIHLLLWDYTMLYALDREALPSISLDWKTPEQISVCLDDVLPVGACHHQKIVVIDDAVAYCGGFDLTTRRWDTPAHDIHDDNRVGADGVAYRPFHDLQMLVDGDAALALGEVIRERWRRAACETPIAPETTGDPWPDDVDADFTDIGVGIARTMPAYDGEAEVREVEALFRRAIAAAQDTIYIECQYLTSISVAGYLTDRLVENSKLEVLIVAPNVHQSWLEERSMNTGRRHFLARLMEAGVDNRVRLMYPAIPDDHTGEGVMVHAKFMIVDDCFLRVGSANINNRSMGMDTECDLALAPDIPEQRKTVTRFRDRLVALHLGLEPDAVTTAIRERGTLIAAVDALSDGPRSLQPIDLSAVPDDELARAVGQVADPERPVATPDFVGDMFGGSKTGRSIPGAVKLGTIAVLVLGLVAVWRYTPLADFTDPRDLVAWLGKIGEEFMMPLIMPTIYVLGGLVAFPVTALIAVTSMMFDPLVALAYALGGSLLSSAVTFWIGHAVGRGPLRGWMGIRVNRISRRLARRGVVSVAALRMVPVAPFSFINIVAGASHIGFLDFMLGTLAGMMPGIVVICFLGNQLTRTLNDPEPSQILLLAAGLVAWLALSIGLQYLASKLNPGQSD